MEHDIAAVEKFAREEGWTPSGTAWEVSRTTKGAQCWAQGLEHCEDVKDDLGELIVYRKGNSFAVTVFDDDGNSLDWEKVKENMDPEIKAQVDGRISPQTQVEEYRGALYTTRRKYWNMFDTPPADWLC